VRPPSLAAKVASAAAAGLAALLAAPAVPGRLSLLVAVALGLGTMVVTRALQRRRG